MLDLYPVPLPWFTEISTNIVELVPYKGIYGSFLYTLYASKPIHPVKHHLVPV